MKKCQLCGEKMKLTQNICTNCNFDNSYNMKKNHKKILLITILILVIIIAPQLIIKTKKQQENSNQKLMLSDAQTFIANAEIQSFIEKNVDCFYIYGSSESIYENAGNYVGSVLVTEDNAEIWLSDGNYMVTGTSDNLKIFKSSLTASKNCNR